MKKSISAVACLILVLFTIQSVALASAESTDSTTTTTTLNITTTTAPPVLTASDFEFEYSGSIVTVTWNAEKANGKKVKNVLIGGKSEPIYETGTTNRFTFSINGYNPGVYKLTYVLDNQLIISAKNIYCSGTVYADIQLSQVDGHLKATVTNSNNKKVFGVTVVCYFADESYDEPAVTDENGVARFNRLLPSDISKIHCKLKARDEYENGTIVINYIADDAWLSGSRSSTTSNHSATTSATRNITTTTTSKSKSTTPKDNTTAGTTKATLPVITGAGTTAKLGDKVAINVSFDTGVPKLFGYSENDFAARSRLLMTQKLYSDTIGTSTASMMLLARSSSIDITDQSISKAIHGKSKYSLFQPEKTLRIPLDLTMQIVDKKQKVNTPVPMQDAEVTVELPVPKSMIKDYLIAAAAVGQDGSLQIIDATVKDGVLQFTTNRLSAVAILGFDDSEHVSRGSIPFIPLFMIIIGVLMLGGAFTLLYFFFLRKPAIQTVTDTDNGDMQVFDSSSLFSVPGDRIKSDMFDTAAESDTELTDKTQSGVSLGSLMNKENQDDRF